MAGVNKVILVGNLGADPESAVLRQRRRGGQLARRDRESWKDRDGNRQEKTEWHSVAIFNENLGRVAKKLSAKGSKVYLEGQLQTRKWQDQSGNDRYTTEIVLQKFRGELVLLDAREGGGGGGGLWWRRGEFDRRRLWRLRRRRLQAPIPPATRGVRHRPRRRRSLLGSDKAAMRLTHGRMIVR